MTAAAESSLDQAIERVRKVYGGWRRDTPVAQMRADWDDLFWSDAVPVQTHPVVANGVDAVWISPRDVARDRVLVYLHGGGFKVGSVRSHRDLMARIAHAAQCRVLGLDYRLAPEHRFPAPIDDAVAAYGWLLAAGIPSNRIVLAGDSAGGGLAISVVYALRNRGLSLPAALVTLSAWTDLTAAGESYVTRASADPIHQRSMILATARNYLGEAGDPRDPLASPLFGDLAGLPPILLQVGDRETGLDDSRLLAEKAKQLGVDAQLEVWGGMIHVFQQFAQELPEARQAIANIGTFLNTIWSRS